MADIVWDPAAFDLLIGAVSGTVLRDLREETEDIARAISPVQVRHAWWVRHRRPPGGGELRASIVSWESELDGEPAAYVGSLWYGRYLDPRSRQMHRDHPFLPTALSLAVDGRVFYF